MKIKRCDIPILVAVWILSFFFQSCNEGISPEPEYAQPGFGGTISFTGDWASDVARTHIVLFKDALEDSSDFNAFNLRFVSNEIPYGVANFSYSSITDLLAGNIEPGEYAYLAVAQSNTPTISFSRKDWYIVGLYASSQNPNEAAKLIIPQNKFIGDINIVCDFNNPPPQPPGGN